ncbi:hypothetical protein FIBSPDRAFT_55131 [Athelia psychrophila]|uniref:Uncharacterized protein n=1 Tax=Athelia psychrophila TaxID=1759441 RepID=A0A166FEL1_9AGAM|nr:hypothetical protein FIBSPDRAFT_55131 [Fibularhizoctonia sp. CBS 109695]
MSNRTSSPRYRQISGFRVTRCQPLSRRCPQMSRCLLPYLPPNCALWHLESLSFFNITARWLVVTGLVRVPCRLFVGFWQCIGTPCRMIACAVTPCGINA